VVSQGEQRPDSNFYVSEWLIGGHDQRV